MGDHKTYPYQDGDITVLGPEIFASNDGQVISWKGDNYVAQSVGITATGPALHYTSTMNGDGLQSIQRLDLEAPEGSRERAVCRALLHHALALLDATEPTCKAPVGMEARRL